MTAFSVSPVGPFAQATDEGFPEFVQFQDQGVDLGEPDADTLNFGSGLEATRGVGENANVVEVTANRIQWRDVYGDDYVTVADISGGIATQGTSGSQVIAIQSGILLDGESVLVLQQGAAPAEFVVDSGMTLLYRTDTFAPATAGQGAIVTLLAKGDDTIILCGDMASL